MSALVRRRFGVTTALAVIAFACAAPAPAQPNAATRIPTVSRLVRMFSELETALGAHAASHDRAALAAMLADDFEMRGGSAPGTPIPRDDWINRTMQTGAHPTLDQMSVRDFGDVAIVAFRAHPPRGAALFVIDCWKRDAAQWKLAARYVANAAAPSSVAPAPSERIEKRY